MKTHPPLGCEIFCNISSLQPVIPVVKHHHERWDGRGYPEGLKEKKIPVEARIIAASDTYDAMTSDRPYRKGLPHEVAVEEIQKHSGAQFDPDIVKAFMKAVSEGAFPLKEETEQLIIS